MMLDGLEGLKAVQPGEWVAVADGRVVAHGFDFREVAEDACRQADDIAFDRVPPHSPAGERTASCELAVPAFPTRHRRAAGAPPRKAAPLPPLLR
ncbi:MAG: DUF5678 domain-containing protein [bacterium]